MLLSLPQRFLRSFRHGCVALSCSRSFAATVQRSAVTQAALARALRALAPNVPNDTDITDVPEDKSFSTVTRPTVDEEIRVVMERVRRTEVEESGENAIVKALQKLVDRIFPHYDFVVAPFGSAINGFGWKNGDLDVMVIGTGITSKKIKKTMLHKLAHRLRSQGHEVETILHARVPLVKARIHGTDVDVSFNNLVALENSKMLRLYSTIDERVPLLTVAVKAWAKNRGINDAPAGTFSSYCLAVMVIAYLQRTSPPVLPFLQKEGLGKGTKAKASRFMLDGHNVYFYKDVDSLLDFGAKNSATVQELLLGFFETYTEVLKNPSGHLVCIKEPCGFVVSRRDRKRLIERVASKSPLCVIDPFDRTRNVAASVASVPAVLLQFERALRLTRQGRSFRALCGTKKPWKSRK